VLENDDRVYTVEDLLPVCERLEVPLVYDVHHHRCNPDRLSIERATELAAETFDGREPWAHLSSPALGWNGADPRPHADSICPRDVPACWLGRTLTIDVEAKAKERAVLRLRRWLNRATREAGVAAVRPEQPPGAAKTTTGSAASARDGRGCVRVLGRTRRETGATAGSRSA
jgi:UV DNA damage repair endonuclease